MVMNDTIKATATPKAAKTPNSTRICILETYRDKKPTKVVNDVKKQGTII